MNADNDFDGWFDNIIKMRSKKLVVSGVPDGYTVTYDDNRTSNEYPSGYDPEYFYINLTKTATTPAPELSNIEVTAPPAKTEYMVGETFDPTGLKVTAHYTNGGADKVLAAGAYTLSAPNMNTAGTKTVTVTYTEGSITKTTTFSIVVDSVPIVLSSIEVTTPPAKTVYTEGESFDKAGMVVTARYSDSSTAEVTGYTYSPTGMLSTSDSTVTISYEEGGVTKTASTPITVNAVPVTLSSIVVTTPPTKTEYAIGEIFDPTGMKVTAKYTNGGADRVLGTHEYTIDAVDTSTPGTKDVIIRHTDGGVEKTHHFTVTVAEALQPSPNPQPTEPTGTSDPQPTTSQPIEAGTQASDDNSSNTGEGEEIPKTGVDDIRPMMSIVFITAALALFILFMQVMKREKIRLQDFGKNGK